MSFSGAAMVEILWDDAISRNCVHLEMARHFGWFRLRFWREVFNQLTLKSRLHHPGDWSHDAEILSTKLKSDLGSEEVSELQFAWRVPRTSRIPPGFVVFNVPVPFMQSLWQ
jgi:hypothetical protein